jgi:diaminohydroxyphosphoribosylaminopyrimidine deaminase/5-amino-6-(5-phosphoribosylamino)uracil reductase
MTRLAQVQDELSLRTLLHELGTAARAWRFAVAPNPCVGAAVLAGPQVLARGFHEVWGGNHAEVQALAAAEASGVPREAWDTLVVTLEPCSTTGKTPPCVDHILASGVRTVIVGERDPDPRHRGRGLELLRARGLEVVLLEGAAPLSEVSPHFLRWNAPDRLRRPRPWTIAKWAQTLTGQLSPPEAIGGGRWISSKPALAEVLLLRGRVDAVLTGVGTIVDDDPRLTVRPPGDPSKRPWRVVLDSYLRTPPGARLFAEPGPGEGAGEVHIACILGADQGREHALVRAGAHVHGLRGTDKHHLDLRGVHAWLWEQGIRRVLLEAGPHLLGSHLDAGFLDQVHLVTGSVRGGRGESLANRLARAKLLERRDREVGPDAVLEAFLEAQ